MSIHITMPALSPTMEEGRLVKWLVKEGDFVQSGAVLAEIETDKAVMEIEAVDEGIIAKILIPEDTQNVKVNSVIAILAEEGEDLETIDYSPAGDIATLQSSQMSESVMETPIVLPKESILAAPKGEDATTSSSVATTIIASPLARRLATERGIDLRTCKGSGPYGRIIKRDIDAISLDANKHDTVKSDLDKVMPSEQSVLALFKQGDYEFVAHNSMRKTIARRLVESKQTIPHFYVTIDCELDPLLALRSALNEAAPMQLIDGNSVPSYKLSVNDMVIKAVALALQQVPNANVSWLDSGMIRHKHVDVAVAVAIPDGLITPIIRYADEKSLPIISNEMKDLAVRARNMKLKAEEYQGGMTSVSNMGMFGIRAFSAIINPPQATIFAIGSAEKRVMVQEDTIKTATMMTVTLSADHRAVDGALAAKLLQTFKQLLEKPLRLLV